MSTPPRRRSPLEDDSLVQIERPAASSGDLCERCRCTRSRHGDDGCECGRCDEFLEFDGT